MSVDIDGIVSEFTKKHSIAIDELTEAQVAIVLKQIIACGDLARHVRITDNAQQVVYMPYAREQALETRIFKLQELLRNNGIQEPAEYAVEYVNIHEY